MRVGRRGCGSTRTSSLGEERAPRVLRLHSPALDLQQPEGVKDQDGDEADVDLPPAVPEVRGPLVCVVVVVPPLADDEPARPDTVHRTVRGVEVPVDAERQEQPPCPPVVLVPVVGADVPDRVDRPALEGVRGDADEVRDTQHRHVERERQEEADEGVRDVDGDPPAGLVQPVDAELVRVVHLVVEAAAALGEVAVRALVGRELDSHHSPPEPRVHGRVRVLGGVDAQMVYPVHQRPCAACQHRDEDPDGGCEPPQEPSELHTTVSEPPMVQNGDGQRVDQVRCTEYGPADAGLRHEAPPSR